MAWDDLSSELEETFAGLQAWEPGLPQAVKAARKAPPPDPRRAALERAATALIEAHDAPAREQAQRDRVAAWCRENQEVRSQRQRQRRAARREREGRSPMGPKPENAWRCGPKRKRALQASG